MILKSIYVISTINKSIKHKFKIGKHKGTQKKLLSRYKTYLINPIIFYFRPVINHTLVENQIKSKLDKFRIKDKDGAYTEWFQLELCQIIFEINNVIYSLNNQIDSKEKLNEDFNKINIVQSDKKMEIFDSILIYFNEIYIKKNKDINLKFTNFYNDYVNYMKLLQLEIPSKILVRKILKNNRIDLINENHVRYIKISVVTLINILKNNS